MNETYGENLNNEYIYIGYEDERAIGGKFLSPSSAVAQDALMALANLRDTGSDGKLHLFFLFR